MLDALRILYTFLRRNGIDTDDVKIVFLARDERTAFRIERALKADPGLAKLTMYGQTAELSSFNARDFQYGGLRVAVKEAKRDA